VSLPGHHLALLPQWPFVQLKRSKPSGFRPSRKYRIFDRFWSDTPLRGEPYLGLTATEVVPRQARRGILHPSTWSDPGRLLRRAVLPWRLLGQQGTVAADPGTYPFGTQMFVKGHGWCRVEDTGGDIKGPTRVDLYYGSHRDALEWGRQRVRVLVVPPGASRLDRLPSLVRGVAWAVDTVKHALF